MKSRLLVIGKSGFLGASLSEALNTDLFQTFSVGREQLELQFSISSSFDRFLAGGGFQYALICAAITDVEQCFRDQVTSERVNVVGTVELLKLLKNNKIIPIFFSSDYVFKASESLCREEDLREPTTCYGQQKLIVERYIEEKFERFLIFRTSKLMSETNHPKNILLPILKSLAQSKNMKCFVDQWLNPVFLEDVAEVIKLSIKKNLTGTYHLGTRKVYTRYELAKYLAEFFNCASTLIEPIKMKEIAFSETRPTHNTLNCEKIETTLNYKFTELESVIENFKNLAIL